jgi:tetratricopeptide (TPR) repeat protein
MGRYEQAVTAIGQAQQLDPLSLVIHHHAAWVYIHARRFDDAIEQCRKALEMDPHYSIANVWLGIACSQKSMHNEAIAALTKAREFLGDIPFAAAALAHSLAAAGRREQAAELLQKLGSSDQVNHVDPYHLAVVYAAFEEPDPVFECLEGAYREQSLWLTCWLKSDPRLDPVRADPRFSDLLQRIGVGAGRR